MKKMSFLAAMLFTTQSFAGSPSLMLHKSPAALDNYQDVLSAVLDGQDIRLALAVNECTVDGKKVERPMFALGLFTPDAVIVTNDLSIAASMHHFTTNDAHAVGKPVYQFVSYRITPDSTMSVSAQVFDAVYHTAISNKVTYQCKLGVSAMVFAK